MGAEALYASPNLWLHRNSLTSIAVLCNKCLYGGIAMTSLENLFYYLKFISQRRKFKNMGGIITDRYVILSDYKDSAGVAKGHYFNQDLLVASFVHKHKPNRHVDVGSRIDGFVAHVASFREIEVVDIRDLAAPNHSNIKFVQADLMLEQAKIGLTDSLSCLHVIEHFGLGRYGDTVDPEGHKKGFINLVSLLKVGAYFYISFPIGRQNEVHFNAHRIFHPNDIFSWPGCNELELVRFDYVDDSGDLHQDINLRQDPPTVTHGCGVYTFIKK
jgi:Caenorhabditis protein of unknown function, DUF268